MVPGLEGGDTRADRLDDSGALMTAEEREVPGRVPAPDVLVRVAHPGRGEPDPHFG